MSVGTSFLGERVSQCSFDMNIHIERSFDMDTEERNWVLTTPGSEALYKRLLGLLQGLVVCHIGPLQCQYAIWAR